MQHRWTDNLRSPVAMMFFLGTATLGLIADLWSKSAAVQHLRDGDVVRFIPNILHFTYTENHGAVFGIGQGQRALFLIVSCGAVFFLGFLFLTSGKARVYQLILGMLLAGVIGNLYDRYTLGYVRDMIHALPGWHWPDWIVTRLPERWQPPMGRGLEVFPWIFNIADSLLCVGVSSMLLYSFLTECRRERDGERPPANSAAPLSTEKV